MKPAKVAVEGNVIADAPKAALSLVALDALADEIAALPVKARAHRLPDIIRAISKAVAK
jgi:hypothetical protein